MGISFLTNFLIKTNFFSSKSQPTSAYEYMSACLNSSKLCTLSVPASSSGAMYRFVPTWTLTAGGEAVAAGRRFSLKKWEKN
jgi:hypothetical protein